VVVALALLGDMLVDKAAKADDDDKLKQEAVGEQSKQYTLLLYDQRYDSCFNTTGLCRWTPNAPPHGSGGTCL
jgi:hypothetical protein